jgi:hypothetical protein
MLQIIDNDCIAYYNNNTILSLKLYKYSDCSIDSDANIYIIKHQYENPYFLPNDIIIKNYFDDNVNKIIKVSCKNKILTIDNLNFITYFNDINIPFIILYHNKLFISDKAYYYMYSFMDKQIKEISVKELFCVIGKSKYCVDLSTFCSPYLKLFANQIRKFASDIKFIL